jgi:lipid II:glycine glycyltransferase (peptidoglycan interpeptide bridge formation enzyme)
VIHEVHERTEWNALIGRLPGHEVEQTFEWGEVRRQSGWRPHRFAVFLDDVCIGAISILSRTLLGHSALYAPRGPLLEPKDDAAWQGVMDAVALVARRTRAVFLRVSPGAPQEDLPFHEALLRRGFIALPDNWTTWNAPRIVLIGDLTGDEQQVRQRIRRRLREYVAAAPRTGLSVRPAATDDDVRTFYALMLSMGIHKTYPVRKLEHFRALWREFVSRGLGVLLLAEKAGVPAGGLLGVKCDHVAYMICASVRGHREGGKLQPGPLLYWSFLQWARAEGCRAINWGGSGTNFPPRRDDPGYGVYQFKRGFGSALEYRVGYYDLPLRPALYRTFRVAEQRFSSVAWNLRARLNHLGQVSASSARTKR